MKYYNLTIEPAEDDRDLVCTLDENTLRIGWNTNTDAKSFDFAPDDYNWGKPVHDWPKGVTFLYEEKEGYRVPDYFFSIPAFPLFSKRAVDGLRDCLGTQIQLLDVTLLETCTGKRDESYKIVNIIYVIDVMCWEHAKYKKFPVNPDDDTDDRVFLMMIKPAFKKNEIDRIRPTIFKTKEDEVPMYVSEEYKNYCKKEKLTGFGFREVKQV